MNIIVISSSAPFGSGESFVVSEVNALAARGLRITLFPTVLRKGNPNKFDFHKNVSVLAYPLLSGAAVWSVLRLALFDTGLLLRLIKLAASSSLGNLAKNLAVLPKSVQIAQYVKNSGIEHIHSHWLTASSTLAMMVSEQTAVPWSVTAHRGDIVSSNALQKKFDSSSFVRFISCNGVDLAKSRAQLNDDKCKVLHMGVTTPLDDPPRVIKSESAVVTILCPANLLPVKGHSILLRALARLKSKESVRLELAGDGKLSKRLKELAHDLGLSDKVVFLGHVPHRKLIDAYKKSEVDIVVLPSLDLGNGVHEGIPVSLMEAMAWGVPVVSTRTGGIPELLVNELGENVGALVNAGDDLALAEALDALIASPDLRAELGARGRSHVTSKFNQDLVVMDLIKLMSPAKNKVPQENVDI